MLNRILDWQKKQLDLFEPEVESLWGDWLDEVSKTWEASDGTIWKIGGSGYGTIQ